jgi:hypothetical protein
MVVSQWFLQGVLGREIGRDGREVKPGPAQPCYAAAPQKTSYSAPRELRKPFHGVIAPARQRDHAMDRRRALGQP